MIAVFIHKAEDKNRSLKALGNLLKKTYVYKAKFKNNYNK